MVSLPERWILDQYMRMLSRVLRAARAHMRHSHQTAVDRLTHCISGESPQLDSVTDNDIQCYLTAVGRTIVEVRHACNDLFDENDQPYKLVQVDASGACTALSPGCEAAASLLDAVHNVPDLLTSWGLDLWCRPRLIYDELRQHEIEFESGLARYTGFLQPIDTVAPVSWDCDEGG